MRRSALGSISAGSMEPREGGRMTRSGTGSESSRRAPTAAAAATTLGVVFIANRDGKGVSAPADSCPEPATASSSGSSTGGFGVSIVGATLGRGSLRAPALGVFLANHDRMRGAPVSSAATGGASAGAAISGGGSGLGSTVTVWNQRSLQRAH